MAKLLRVAGYAAFRTTVGYLHHRCLPCHQGSQCAHLFEVGPGVEAHSSLIWAPGGVMLHPVPSENLKLTGVHSYRHRHRELPPRPAHQLLKLVVDLQVPGGLLEEPGDPPQTKSCHLWVEQQPYCTPFTGPSGCPSGSLLYLPEKAYVKPGTLLRFTVAPDSNQAGGVLPWHPMGVGL